MVRLRSVAFLAVLLPLLGACAGGNFWLRNGPVKIRTNPEGALATSEHGDSCVTPCTLRIRTGKGGFIRLSKDGYEDVDVYVGSHFDPVRPALRAAGHAVDPDPADIAFDAAFMLIDKGYNRRLDVHRVEVDMPLAGRTESMEIMQASAQETGGDGAVRLSQDEVETILGPPVPVLKSGISSTRSEGGG